MRESKFSKLPHYEMVILAMFSLKVLAINFFFHSGCSYFQFSTFRFQLVELWWGNQPQLEDLAVPICTVSWTLTTKKAWTKRNVWNLQNSVSLLQSQEMVQVEDVWGKRSLRSILPYDLTEFSLFAFFRIAVITKDGVERRLFLNNELPEFGKLCDMPAIK